MGVPVYCDCGIVMLILECQVLSNCSPDSLDNHNVNSGRDSYNRIEEKLAFGGCEWSVIFLYSMSFAAALSNKN